MTIKTETSRKIVQFLNALGIIGTLLFCYYGYRAGLFTDAQKMQAILSSVGLFAPIVFVMIQIVQTVIPIIPGALTIPMGTVIFGHWSGFLLNWFGIMIGSVINFWLARRYGRRLVAAITSQRQYDQAIGWLEGDAFARIFTFGMFFPISPADLLCYIAGLSNLTFRRFLFILSLGKPLTLLIYSYGILTVLRLIGQLLPTLS